MALDLSRDFHDPELKRKAKKLIDIELDMHFGSGLRAELHQPIVNLANGSDVVTIRKRWLFEPVTRKPTVELFFGAAGSEPSEVAPGDVSLVERLLGSVRFRYVSNHIHPTDLLRNEEENIRRGLFRRLGKSRSFSADQIEKIREAAGSLMDPISEELEGSSAGVSNIELGTPKDWGELLWAFGLRMQTGESVAREAVLHGSGIQSTLAYAILHMLDTSLESDFGWRRGAIWALEEPESFLHADLQAQLAESLSQYSNSDRLQIFFTTHNAAFLGVADAGIQVNISDATSKVSPLPRTSLIDKAVSSGVAPFTHPLHIGSIKPLLLVEGRDDRELLIRAYVDSQEACPYEIKAMEDIESSTTGGVDQIQSYLSNNRSALRARPTSSPVIVLLDHEVSQGSQNKIRSALHEHSTSECHVFPKDKRTPRLREDIAGIEAYLSLSFYEAAEAENGLIVVRPGNPEQAGYTLGIDKSEMGKRKQDIHKLLRERNEPSDIIQITRLVPWISKLLRQGGQTVLGV